MRTHVDLFTGIGGFSLACEWAGVETIAFSEVDSYASRVLQRHWPNVRNYGDVRRFPSLSAWLLTAGVPCQPASVAGKRKGAADDRWLWPQTLAVVENGSYEWLLFENPTGILSLNHGLEFERICAALESKGYEVQPLVIPACGIGAPHRRNRSWIIAHAGGERRQQITGSSFSDEGVGEAVGNPTSARSHAAAHARVHSEKESRRARHEKPERRGERPGGRSIRASDPSMADAPCECINGSRSAGQGWRAELANGSGWAVEPDVGRVAHGIPARVDRLRGLGNAIVPQVAYQLIKRMIEAEESLSFNRGETL